MLIRALCLGKIILRQSLQQNSWKTFVMTLIMFGIIGIENIII